MTDNLLACPFCGGRAEMRESSTHDFYAKCAGCGASTRRNHENRNGAVMDWNTRAERTCEVLGEDYDELLDYWETELSCGHTYIGMKQYVNYCPSCGAKVTKEAANG